MKWCHTPAMFALMVLKHYHESQVNLGSKTRPVSTGRERHRETDRQTGGDMKDVVSKAEMRRKEGVML